MGVLQETGVLIPFARYNGTSWTNSWPAPIDQEAPDPMARSQVAPEWIGGGTLPTSWRLWMPSGSVHQIRIQGPTFSKSACAHIWGLMTDFPKALNTPLGTCPTRTIGIALSTARDLRVAHHASIFTPTAAMEKAFVAAETRTVTELKAPWDLRNRAEFPIKLDSAWRFDLASGETFYYLEAFRRFSNAPLSTDCEDISFFQGWIARTKAQQDIVVSSKVVLTDCDFKGPESMVPMGWFETANGTFVIVQKNGWESQSYGILKLERDGVTRLVDSPVR